MPSIYLPQSFRDEAIRDKMARYQEIAEVEATLAEFNAELRQLDPYLRMIKALPNIPPESDLKAGYYHIIRDEPNSPLYVTPLMWDNGEYREPGSWIYEHLQHEDLWNDRAQKARAKRREEFRAAEKRARDREQQARADEYTDRYNHALNARISVPRSITG